MENKLFYAESQSVCGRQDVETCRNRISLSSADNFILFIILSTWICFTSARENTWIRVRRAVHLYYNNSECAWNFTIRQFLVESNNDVFSLEFQYIQVAYFVIALLNDVITSSTLQIVRDSLFASLTIPFAFMTTLMYFGISFIDPEMVFPVALRPHFPLWLDFCLHTSISIFPIIEIFLSRHHYSSRWTNIKILIAGLISYSVWIHVVYYKTGFWVYDIFAQFDDMQRTIFFAASGIIGITLYIVGEFLNYAIVGTVGTKSKKTKPQKKKSK